MSSREIAELTAKRHGDVMRDIRSMIDSLEQNANLRSAYKSTSYIGSNGQSYPQYELDKDLTLTLMLGYDTAARFKVVQRWQELEMQARLGFDPNDDIQVLEYALEQRKANRALQIELEQAKPAVQFVEKYVDGSGLMGFRQVCKTLKAKENEFRNFLLEQKIMYRLNGRLTAYAQHIDAGRFAIKTGVSGQSGHIFTESMFTPKGVSWIAGEWAKHQIQRELCGANGGAA